MTQTSDQIEQQAARWLVQIDSQGSPEGWAALDAWLASNPRHRAAFLRLSVSWRSLDRLRNLRRLEDSVNENLMSPRAVRKWKAHGRAPSGRPRWSFGWQPVATAAIVLMALAAVMPWATRHFSAHSYVTELGRRQHIELADGSTVDLNTNSQLRVQLTAQRREIMLLRGEAAFNVAHDPSRPFDVQAGGSTFRAVGTAFSVRLHATRAEVRVTEGRVAIDPPFTQVITPGEIATVARGHVWLKQVPLSILTSKLTWTQGRLFFSGETLAEAVAEFNRYNSRRMVIVDPKIAALQISGIFAATNPESFVTALEEPFGIRALPARGASDETIRLDDQDR